MAARATLSHDDYTVGWICALPLEMAAAKLMLDAIHPSLPRPPTDQNTYILGNIGDHNIVIACLPSGAYGIVSAATVAMQLLSSFHSIRFGLMVGIGGGVPNGNADVRLGDIVVSQPTDTSGGVIQYDLGKVLSGGQFQRTGMLNRPPKVLLTALATLQAHHFTEESRILEFISEVVKDGRRRDQLAQDLGVYCVEMEAAGLMNDFPCLVIRGICDYADSHKNKEWQGYAAMAAAAYAKELVLVVPIDQVKTTPTARDTLADPVHRFNVPLDLTAVPVIANFVGRQEEIDNLWQYLQPTDSPSRKVAILHGLGGIGKTQLAIRFARDHRDDFTAIFWLHGKDRDALLQSLSFALNRLPEKYWDRETINDEDVEQRARQMLRWLGLDGNSRWLIIFDNVDRYHPFDSSISDGYDIAEFFPKADHGSILITSRLQGLTELGEPFPVRRLDSHSSIQLLLQSSGVSLRNTTSKLDSNSDVLALANRLYGLPLAIVLAGAFMRETGTSITEYLQYYQESWSELQLQSNPGHQYQQGNMLQTWMISYLEIQKRDPSAAELLLLLARFDNRDIWYELVKSGRHSSNVPDWLKKAISSGLEFKIGDLYSDQGKLKEAEEMYQRALAGKEKALGPDHTSTLRTVNNLGLLYKNQGKLKEAEAMYQRALVGQEKALGPDHTSTLDSVHCLGILYKDQGKLNEAEEMYQRALAGYEKALGPNHTSTLDTVNNLGVLYSDQGKLKEAEEMYQRALVGQVKALGSDHTSTLDTVNNLGNLYKDQGKLKEAEEMYQRALAGYEKALGSDHTSTLDTVNNLGNLYKDQGKLKEAEMYQRALPNNEKAAHLNASTARRAIKKFARFFR
ncbi:hypothetical protein E8E15_004199 [Penicillium rubens]|nr:hypothetical protein E8E15_004199 [Penicillium rubens]